MKEASQQRVCALIVTYQPDPEMLPRVVERIVHQAEHVLLVDNASDELDSKRLEKNASGRMDALRLPENIGLAAAQNQGLDWIASRGFTHVLLLDQDSLVEPGMLSKLMQGLRDLQKTGMPVGGVGPVYIDPRTQARRPFVRFRVLGVERSDCDVATPYPETDFLIASGSLIPLQVIKTVGAFEGPLFIDNIDLEWSFRVRAAGYRLFGVCSARMVHQLGDDALRIWLGRWWHVYRHSPLRQYYMARNRVILYRRPYSSKAWIIQDLLRFMIKLIMFGLVFAPRRENLKMIFRGLRDGIANRLGRYQD